MRIRLNVYSAEKSRERTFLYLSILMSAEGRGERRGGWRSFCLSVSSRHFLSATNTIPWREWREIRCYSPDKYPFFSLNKLSLFDWFSRTVDASLSRCFPARPETSLTFQSPNRFETFRCTSCQLVCKTARSSNCQSKRNTRQTDSLFNDRC